MMSEWIQSYRGWEPGGGAVMGGMAPIIPGIPPAPTAAFGPSKICNKQVGHVGNHEDVQHSGISVTSLTHTEKLIPY